MAAAPARLSPLTPNAPPSERPSLETVIVEEERSSRRRKIGFGLGVGLLLAAVAVTATLMWPSPPAPVEQYRTEVVGQGELVRSISATGRVEPRSQVEVGAQISGRIEAVTVDFDERVRAGQVLARFDTDSLAAQRAQSQANIRAAAAALRKAKVDAKEAERQLQRTQSLFGRGIESRERLENAESAVAVARAAVDNATAQLALHRANGEVAETNLEYAEIRSPIDGVVISRNIEPGQTVAATFQTPVLFVIAEDLAKMQVSASIDEADIGEVRPGQQAEFTVDAYGGRAFTAELVAVRTAPTIAQNVVTYEAILEVDNDDLSLKPGMTASVDIRTASLREAIQVPNAALRFTPPDREAEGGKHTVWVLRGEAVVPVHVEPGITDGTMTAIESDSGIEPGDQVIVDLTKIGREYHADDDE